MTTYIDFVPSANSNFQFQATFDGSIYTVIITWSLFGVRYYVNIYDLNGNLIVSRPMVGSPNGYQLSNVIDDNGTAIATTEVPHDFPVGSLVNLQMSGIIPTDYDGNFPCRILNNTQFSYKLATNPSDAVSFGSASYNISLTAGYFTTQLVWRSQNQQFEIV